MLSWDGLFWKAARRRHGCSLCSAPAKFHVTDGPTQLVVIWSSCRVQVLVMVIPFVRWRQFFEQLHFVPVGFSAALERTSQYVTFGIQVQCDLPTFVHGRTTSADRLIPKLQPLKWRIHYALAEKPSASDKWGSCFLIQNDITNFAVIASYLLEQLKVMAPVSVSGIFVPPPTGEPSSHVLFACIYFS